jgi:hypothetical protein
MKIIEAEISRTKNENYESLTKPVCAFITFQDEDGYIIA